MPAQKRTARVLALGEEIGWYEGRVVLNWNKGHNLVLRHDRDCKFCGTWNEQTSPRRRRPDPCPRCGFTAHLLDENKTPWHKTCLEEQLTEELPPPPGQRKRLG